MPDEVDDGKIRIRCTGCGKRVKFPADQPGQAFRCPICKTTIVTPLNGQDVAPPSAAELRSPGFAAPPRVSSPAVRPPEPETSEPVEPPIQADTPIQKITNFLMRETDRAAKLCQQIVDNPSMSVEAQAGQIRHIRNAKAYHFRQFAEATLKEVDSAIAELNDSPVIDTETGKDRLRSLLYERRGLLIFLNVMYEFRRITPQNATGGTPGNGAEQPTKVSPQAARTVRRTNAARPSPSGKGPSSSAPRPS